MEAFKIRIDWICLFAVEMKIMENCKSLLKTYHPKDLAIFAQKRLQCLLEENKHFNNPHIYKVDISASL